MNLLQRRASTRSHHRYSKVVPLLGVALIAVLAVGMTASGATVASELARPSATHEPAAKPKPKPAVRPAKVLGGTGVIRWGPLYRQASGYERFAYVMVSRPDAKKAAGLPGTTLVYTSGTSIQQSWSTGVTYREGLANDWLLKDGDGAYVMNVQYGAFVADIGNSAYQQRFVENMIAFLKRTKVDGVFIDDVLGDPRSMSSVFPAKYPDTEAWESAMASFVQTVGKALKSRGYYVLANAAKWISDDQRSDTGEHVAEFWKRIAPGVSGLMTEYWLQAPDDHANLRVRGSNWDQHWPAWQSLVSVAQSRGSGLLRSDVRVRQRHESDAVRACVVSLGLGRPRRRFPLLQDRSTRSLPPLVGTPTGETAWPETRASAGRLAATLRARNDRGERDERSE